MPSPQALWRWLQQWRRQHLDVDRADVLCHVDENGALGPRYAFMILMSCGIATLGLLQGSAAVIIGAMLISPLMGPIVELGMSLATFDFRSLRDSLKTLVVGIALSLLIAIVIVGVSPLQEPTPEIIARTEPTLFDLLVAVFSGLAGAYATVTRKGETIVGVAIATALMPPLAVVGYGIAVGSGSIAGGAAFLFMTNLLAIAFSVTVMARWYGFAGDDSPKQSAWQAALIIGTFTLLSLPLGLALRDIAARGLAERTIRASLDEAARDIGGRITTLRVDRDGQTLLVDAVLLTPRYAPGLAASLEQSLENRIERPVRVALREVLTADEKQLAAQQATLAQLRESVAGLETTLGRDAQARSARDAAMAALQARALAHFGTFDLLQGGTQARWRLRGDAGLGLAAAHRLEQALQGDEAVVSVQVVPALQALPPIVFPAETAELDPAATAVLEDVAWALARWEAGPVRVVAQAGPREPARALAQSRADAVADWLRAQGRDVQEATVSLEESPGPDAPSLVRVELPAS